MRINIKGDIIPNDYKEVYDWFGWESCCPKDVADQLAVANGEDVEVEINSPGGDVYSGSEIYTALMAYTGNVSVEIVGIAASAASVIAMAGNTVRISPTAQIMIHNVWGKTVGDYREHEHGAGVLKGWNKSIANAYTLKTGMSESELLQLMDKETWLTAQDAVKYKFADEIMFNQNMQLVASIRPILLPRDAINKIKTLLVSGTNESETAFSMQNEGNQNEAPRQVPVDLYQKLFENLERRARV